MKKLGKSKLTIKEFDANARINSSTVTRRFGKWNNALTLAGADISNTFYSDEELLSNIKDAWLKKGKQPSRRDMDNKKAYRSKCRLKKTSCSSMGHFAG